VADKPRWTSTDLAERRIDVRIAHVEQKKQSLEKRLSRLLEEGQPDSGSSEDRSAQLDDLSAELDDVLEELYSLIREQEQRKEAMEERRRIRWDRSYELNKHVTTLSVASIAGVAALSRLLPASSSLASAVGTSLVCFVVAIVTGLLAMEADNMEIVSEGLVSRSTVEQRGRISKASMWVWAGFLGCSESPAQRHSAWGLSS
jgi:Rad3-related DNA helicase